jgi:hypothetical protein
MYFRFGSALVLVIAISLAGVAIEKQCLALRRAVIRQQYRHEALCDASARLRLATEKLGAPDRLLQALDDGRLESDGPNTASVESAQSSRMAKADGTDSAKTDRR